jgi:hypothetical protein
MEKEMTKDEITAAIIELGRETGAGLMEGAVSTAKDEVQMTNQLRTCEFAAIHIIAVCAYNYIHQQSMKIEDYLESLICCVLEEIQFMEENPSNIEKATPGNPHGEILN